MTSRFNRVKVYRVQLPAKNAYYELQEETEQMKAQKFRDKQCGSTVRTDKFGSTLIIDYVIQMRNFARLAK